MPTFKPSAPASTKYFAASAVAIFPTTTSKSGYFDLIDFSVSTTPLVCPCAVSTITASTPAFTSASTRSITSRVTPTPAATLKRPNLSLLAFG